MRISNKFWWSVAISLVIIIVIFTTTFALFWIELSLDEKVFIVRILKENFIYLFGAIFLFLAGLGFIIDGILNNYIIPLSKLSEEATLINTVNSSHRIKMEGSKVLCQLALSINEGAERYEDLKKNVTEKINLARAEVEREKNFLALMISELKDGVIICNEQGRILLYNRQAKRLFSDNNEDPIDSPINDKENKNQKKKPRFDFARYIGLGRSIFEIINKSVIVHSLDEIYEKLKQKKRDVTSSFVVANNYQRLIRIEASPVLDHLRKFSGFILVCLDITQQINAQKRLDLHLQSLISNLRSPAAGIRSAIEAMLEYPEMNYSQLEKFKGIIHHESINLSKILDKAISNYPSYIHPRWPVVPIPAKDLADVIIKHAKNKLSIAINKPDNGDYDDEDWLKIDSYSFILSFLFLMNKIKNESGKVEFTLNISKSERYLNIDIIWHGSPVKIETLKRWEEENLHIKDEGMAISLKEVLHHHQADICSYSSSTSNKSYIRFLIPLSEDREGEIIPNLTILPPSRPEFYDFNLFNQSGQTKELDNRKLTELSYTIFDTETTGLDPRGGDQIISIGAVRIINGRLLRDELFDQLIDPKRSLPLESIKIHGIQPEMLKGQPSIEQALPLFHRFVGDCILVAHNAAFDMRMLQINEANTGIKFINPVLDTMLLSAVIHPAQESHDIEAIAKRLGINIMGRHTALGDAVTTGEMFLKIISLLGKIGIYTLKEARLASQKTHEARLKY